MDRTENDRWSNTFGVEAGLDRGWGRPSLPWFAEPEYDSSFPNGQPQERYHNSVSASRVPNQIHFSHSPHSLPHLHPNHSFSSHHEPPLLINPTPFPLFTTDNYPRQNPYSRLQSPLSSDSLGGSSSGNISQSTKSTYVDLTEDSPAMPGPARSERGRRTLSRRTSELASPPAKRRRNLTKATSIEEVDLRDVDSESDLARVLERQRAATVREQQEQADKPTKLAEVTCVVCMEELTNMTATHCGKTRHFSRKKHSLTPHRSSLLPYLPNGSTYCRRESGRRAWKGCIKMPDL